MCGFFLSFFKTQDYKRSSKTPSIITTGFLTGFVVVVLFSLAASCWLYRRRSPQTTVVVATTREVEGHRFGVHGRCRSDRSGGRPTSRSPPQSPTLPNDPLKLFLTWEMDHRKVFEVPIDHLELHGDFFLRRPCGGSPGPSERGGGVVRAMWDFHGGCLLYMRAIIRSSNGTLRHFREIRYPRLIGRRQTGYKIFIVEL